MNKVQYIYLKDICSVNQGLQIPISRRHKTNGTNRHFYITIQFLKNSVEDRTYIENPPVSTICTKDDILITRTGSTGKVITGIEGCFHNNFFRVNYDRNKIDGRYLYYCLTSKAKQKEMQLRAGITTIPDLNHFMFLDMKIPYFDLSEQKKISNILDGINKKIELNNKINQELEAMAKTLYEYWFVQFDFPDANGKPYKSSGGKMVYSEALKREIPEGWKSGVASDLFDFNPTMSLPKGSIGNYIDMNALPTDGFMTKDIQKKEFNGGVKFQNGDLVMARITPCLENGKTGLVTLLDEEIGFGSTEFIVLRGKEMSLSSYASCLSRSELFRKYAISNMTGTSGRKRVDAKALEVFSLAIPADDILNKFEEIASTFFDKMTLNTKENQKLTQLRDWLLPMLMNGQVKVRDHANETDELIGG